MPRSTAPRSRIHIGDGLYPAGIAGLLADLRDRSHRSRCRHKHHREHCPSRCAHGASVVAELGGCTAVVIDEATTRTCRSPVWSVPHCLHVVGDRSRRSAASLIRSSCGRRALHAHRRVHFHPAIPGEASMTRRDGRRMPGDHRCDRARSAIDRADPSTPKRASRPPHQGAVPQGVGRGGDRVHDAERGPGTSLSAMVKGFARPDGWRARPRYCRMAAVQSILAARCKHRFASIKCVGSDK